MTNEGSIKNKCCNKFTHDLTIARKEAILTKKELEVCVLIKKNITVKEIATLMNLSTRTVEFHVNNIRGKLHCYTKKDLASLLNKQEAKIGEKENEIK